MFDKEKVYDDEIAPLMSKIIEICKREELPMVAQFYLKQQHPEADCIDDPMYCSTVIIPEKGKILDEHHEHMEFVASAMKWGPNGKPFVMATTIRSI